MKWRDKSIPRPRPSMMPMQIEKCKCDGCGQVTKTRSLFNKDYCATCKPSYFMINDYHEWTESLM